MNQCLSLIPDIPVAKFACAQFIYKKSGPCCTCVNPQAITVGEKIQFSAESNCTSEQVQEDIKEDIKFQGNVSGTAGVCLEQCCTAAESPTALVFEVSVDMSGQTESETRTVCTEMKNTDCACAPASLDNPGVDVVRYASATPAHHRFLFVGLCTGCYLLFSNFWYDADIADGADV